MASPIKRIAPPKKGASGDLGGGQGVSQVSLSGQFLKGVDSSGVLRASEEAGKSMPDPV